MAFSRDEATSPSLDHSLGRFLQSRTDREGHCSSPSNCRALGPILDAHMGVMQINPAHTYDATGSGQNDTSSYEKEITAVVSARFSLE